jgi:hypothetical protein
MFLFRRSNNSLVILCIAMNMHVRIWQWITDT